MAPSVPACWVLAVLSRISWVRPSPSGASSQMPDTDMVVIPDIGRVLLRRRRVVAVIQIEHRVLTGGKIGSYPRPECTGGGVVGLDLVGQFGGAVRAGEQDIVTVCQCRCRQLGVSGYGDQQWKVAQTAGDARCIDAHRLSVLPVGVVPAGRQRRLVDVVHGHCQKRRAVVAGGVARGHLHQVGVVAVGVGRPFEIRGRSKRKFTGTAVNGKKRRIHPSGDVVGQRFGFRVRGRDGHHHRSVFHHSRGARRGNGGVVVDGDDVDGFGFNRARSAVTVGELKLHGACRGVRVPRDIVVGHGSRDRLHHGIRGIGVERDDQRHRAHSAGQRADGGALILHQVADPSHLAGTAALVLHAQPVVDRTVDGDLHAQRSAREVRRVSVADIGARRQGVSGRRLL